MELLILRILGTISIVSVVGMIYGAIEGKEKIGLISVVSLFVCFISVILFAIWS